MAQNSPIEILEDQIRECFGRAVWTHKTHEKCADILNRRNSRIKLWQIILSAITTSGIFITVLGENRIAGIISAIVSMITLGLSTYVKKYDLGSIAQKHASSAISIWDIREKYYSLLTDIRAGLLTENEIRQIRDALQGDLHKIYKGSPRTMDEAYKDATRGLKKSEELTFSDEEIDAFLPKSLRKSDK
jgi:hypothetical protein